MLKPYTICPNCSFINYKVDEKCSNCGHTKNMPQETNGRYPYKEDIPYELQDEIRQFKDMGMYRRAPNDVFRSSILGENEYILLILNSSLFYFIGVRKNDENMRTGWFILTNKKIICYYGPLRGWTGREIIPYQEINHAGVVMDWAGFRKNRFLEIDTNNNSFKFLFGSTTKNLFKRIMFFEADNKLPLERILKSINKRLRARTDR